MRLQTAIAKAWGAVGLAVSSRTLAEMGEERPMLMNALINIADQKLLPVPSGVLIRDKDNQAICSVSITGDLSNEDKHCTVSATRLQAWLPIQAKIN